MREQAPSRSPAIPRTFFAGMGVAFLFAIARWLTEFGSLHSFFDVSGQQDGKRIAAINDTLKHQDAKSAYAPSDFNAGFANVSGQERQQWAKHNCHVLPNVCHDKRLHRLVRYVDNETKSNDESWFIYKERRSEETYTISSIGPSDPDCTVFHPVPHHVVLHGGLSWFLMEFYLRILSSWWTILDQADFIHFKAAFSDPSSIQFYNGHPKITSTQHILMEAFSNHAFTSLDKSFWSSPSVNETTSPCPRYECFSTFIACGYHREGNHNRSSGKHVVEFKPTDMASKHFLERPFQSLKTHIRTEVLGRRQEQMKQVKRDLIQSRTETIGNATLDGWKIIGFSQRTGRRRWINLPQILQRCHERFLSHLILCVEVNMDAPDMQIPERQAIVHGILDGLIGIHGSQQTHAIWMKPHSYMLELLPYIVTPKLWGGWTQYTDRCTVNGYMTKKTDLHHVGHPMGMESLPNCSEYSNATPCNDRMKWDSRDFLVNWTVIETFVQRFLVEPTPVTCAEFEQLAHTDEFVLYTVHCSGNNETAWQTKEFFRARSSFPNLMRNNGLQYGPELVECILTSSRNHPTLTERIADCNHTLDDLVPNRSSMFG